MPPINGDDGVPSGFVPSDPFGVWGDSGSPGPFGRGGNGVIGSSLRYSGVAGLTRAEDNRASGVFGIGPTVGVAGILFGANTAPPSRVGVYGSGSNGQRLGAIGVMGEGDSSIGVLGDSNSGAGVVGDSNSNHGVIGFSSTRIGVLGVGSRNVGVFGISNGTGVIGIGVPAGSFLGNVDVSGTLTKGGGGFRIDHPLEPESRYLCHSFVESPDMKNFYDGIAECGKDGSVVVELPEWFEALNDNFRYQLTPIGAPAPDLYVAEELKENRFTIAGGAPGGRVSWQVTGVRRDPWANANRIPVDPPKEEDARGRYLHPEVYEQPTENGIGYEHRKQALEALQLSRRLSEKV